MINAVLIGNPNTGKTTLYNTLTSSFEHVGNWHGVTVEEKTKVYDYKGQSIKLTDLPGVYSLSPLSFEEEVTVDYILKNPDSIFVNICDENALEKNLYLTLALMEYSCPIILAVNRTNKRPLVKVNFSLLRQMLGLNVVLIDAKNKESSRAVNDAILSLSRDLNNGKNIKYNLPYYKKIDFSKVNKYISGDNDKKDFFAIKLLENDEKTQKKLKINVNFDNFEQIIALRFEYIDSIINKTCSKKLRVQGKSKLDNLLLNKYLAFPFFILFLGVVFYLTFFLIGKNMTSYLDIFLSKFFGQPLLNFLSKTFGSESVIFAFFDKAIIGGFGAVLSFLPQVVLLFFFLSLLEDSGYLSRVAFVFDDLLSKVGLSGKSVYTLLMGFGCSTTSVITARTMDDKNSKIKAFLLAPYMSCSAKFPIYAVIGGAFFGANNIFVIIALYLLGLIVAILMSSIFEKTILRSKEQSFILEFPSYRMISLGKSLKILWQNTKTFILRVGSGILAMNVVVFILSNFSFSFKYLPSGSGSMLETCGKILAPVFIPLGFGKWEIASSLTSGVVAKEVILSSLLMFYGQGNFDMLFTNKGAVLSFLVFTLLYCPCLSSIIVLKQEIGRKWTLFGVAVQLISAYLISLLVYTLYLLICRFGLVKICIIVAVFLIVFLAISHLFGIKKRKKCPFMSSCSLCEREEK